MKLNEISKETLASYVKKRSSQLSDLSKEDRIQKGTKETNVTKQNPKADELKAKLAAKGRTHDYIPSSKSEKEDYEYKGKQWVSKKTGRIANKEVGTSLSKSAKERGNVSPSKYSHALKGIHQASEKLSKTEEPKSKNKKDYTSKIKAKLSDLSKKISATTKSEIEKRGKALSRDVQAVGKGIKAGTAAYKDKSAERKEERALKNIQKSRDRKASILKKERKKRDEFAKNTSPEKEEPKKAPSDTPIINNKNDRSGDTKSKERLAKLKLKKEKIRGKYKVKQAKVEAKAISKYSKNISKPKSKSTTPRKKKGDTLYKKLSKAIKGANRGL